MKNPFLIIKEKRHEFELRWVSRTFAGSNTFRFLRNASAAHVRELVRTTIRDGSSLSKVKSQRAFDSALARLMKRRKERGHLPFGHAAKLTNFYVKELISRPGILNASSANKIRKWAHVPIDRVILRSLRDHFPEHPAVRAVLAGASLKELKEAQYEALQKLLGDMATDVEMDPIDYDLWWSAT